jgi:hypothetical protein
MLNNDTDWGIVLASGSFQVPKSWFINNCATSFQDAPKEQKKNEVHLLQTPGIEPGTFCEPKHMCCNAVLDRNHNR